MHSQIREALTKLNPEADVLWTEDGLPTVDAVNSRIKGTTTREEITAAAPKFTRQSLDARSAEQIEADAKTDGFEDLDSNDEQGDNPPGEVATEDPGPTPGHSPTPDVARQIAVIDTQLAEVRAERDEVLQARADGVLRQKQLDEAEEQLLDHRAKLSPNPTAAQAIKAFQESQLAQRAKRAIQPQPVGASGASPIDAARLAARKNHVRPVPPMFARSSE